MGQQSSESSLTEEEKLSQKQQRDFDSAAKEAAKDLDIDYGDKTEDEQETLKNSIAQEQ